MSVESLKYKTIQCKRFVELSDKRYPYVSLKGNISNSPRTAKIVTFNNTPTISVEQAKFGVSSFKTTTDQNYMTVPGTGFAFGLNPFTYEMWVWLNNPGVQQSIMDCRINSTDLAVLINKKADNKLEFYIPGMVTTDTNNFPYQQWVHIAAVREIGGVHKLYVNGSLVGTPSTNNTLSIIANRQLFGANRAGTTNMNGYIDEIRVSNIARYSGNFTPQQAPFYNDGNTVLLLHCNDYKSTSTTTTLDDNN